MIRKKHQRFCLFILLLFFGTLTSCEFGTHTESEDQDAFHQELVQAALQWCAKGIHPMGDHVLKKHYTETQRLCWVHDFSDSLPVQTLLQAFSQVEQHGLLPEQFRYEELWQEYLFLSALPFDTLKTLPERLAAFDYRLTESYLLYVRGLRFGFSDPYKLFNTQEQEEVEQGGRMVKQDRILYDIPVEKCDTLFLQTALSEVGRTLPAYLESVYPQDSLYTRLMKTRFAEREKQVSRIVMQEMRRWRLVDPVPAGRRVHVNLATQQLRAYDDKGRLAVQMKVCVGSVRHKSPMLVSEMNRMEVNPYWNVPSSIVRNEIIPGYRKDTTYFSSRRMKVFYKGEEVAPDQIDWAEVSTRTLPYRVRQNNGPGNSLGRMVFRFPNKFDVYLHDTPSRFAFQRTNRAVSHGCIRLENPLEFLAFSEPNANRLQQIKKALEPDETGAYRLRSFELSARVPLLLQYDPVEIDEIQHEFIFSQDPYDYTTKVWNALKTVKPD